MKTTTKHNIDAEEAYRQKIRDEEEYRDQLREQNNTAQPKKNGLGVFGWILIIFVVLFAITYAAINPSAQVEKAKKATEHYQATQAAHKIPYSPLSNGNFNYIL